MNRHHVILVVDDEPKNVRLLQSILTLQGYEVVTAANGQQGIAVVARQRIDLILLDVMMPGMDGFEVTRSLRADPSHRLIPIVLLTALDASEDRVRGIEAGCDDFVSKPFDHNELLARIKTLLTLSYYRQQLDEKEKLTAAIAATGDAIVLCTPDWRVEQFNATAKQLFDLKEGGDESLIDSLRRRYRFTLPVRQLADVEQAPAEFELIRDATDHFGGLHLRVSATLIRNPAGAPTSLVVSAHDVTDLVREQGLKADFVSLISHKLRTPLTPIMLYLSLIRDGTISGDEIGPVVQQLCGQVDRMHSLIERLIEFVSTTQDSRLSSRTKFSITGRLREIVETRDFAARGLVELEPGARPAFVAMHPSLFDVVVRNLIDNGLKFNDSAEPVVIVSGEVNGNCVTVSVRDNGRGIPPEQQKRIFDEFTQVERDFTGSVPGVGLGLAMVRRIVLAYGGRVDVASEVGTGSTLTVTLPAAPVSEEPVLITAPSR